jgi:hypothetical protein
MAWKLPEITEAIERGGGLLTAIEVLEVEDDLASISGPGGSWGKKACQLGEFAICPGAKAGLSRPLISPWRNSA